jgi:hypothetical protein
MSSDYIGPTRLDYVPRKLGCKQVVKPLNVIQILAFDPGGTTGWSRITLHAKSLQLDNPNLAVAIKKQWVHGQIDCFNEQEGAYAMCKLIDESPGAAVVLEDFNIRQIAVDLAPVKLIGAVRQHLWYRGRNWFMQSASQAKTTATDDRLKLWNMYTREGGLQHARDADRHVILFLRKVLQNNELRAEAWSHVFNKP